MKYLISLIILCFSLSPAYGDIVDGKISDSFEVIEVDGISAPSVSPSNTGRLYYDSTLDYILLSENGAAYARLLSTLAADLLYFLLDQTTGQTVSNVDSWTFSNFDSISLTGCPFTTDSTIGAGTLLLQSGSITDSTGAISFDNENLLTTGTLGAGVSTLSTVNFGSATGVSATAINGTLTLQGLGDGFDESMTIDLNTTTNRISIGTTTGATTFGLTGTFTNFGLPNGAYWGQNGCYIPSNFSLLQYQAAAGYITPFRSYNTGMIENTLILYTGHVGIQTTAPDRHLEINVGAATGGIRLTYNDADGSAIVYGDILLDSSGNMSITPTGGTLTVNGDISVSGNYIPQGDLNLGGYGITTINQAGGDYDTVIESDTDANFFFLDAAGAGHLGLGIGTAPTALLHLGAGTTAANTAPFKLTSGPLLTAAEAGAIEFLTDDYYATITTGTARKRFVFADAGGTGGALTATRVPFATTSGRLTDDADMIFATDTLTITKLVITTSLTTVGGTAPVADGTYNVDGSAGGTVSSFTTKSGIITAITTR